MAYAGVNNFAQVANSGPRTPLHPSPYYNTPLQLPSHTVSTGANISQNYRFINYQPRQTSTKIRRASQHSTLLYDASQSPTRSRFQHDPDGYLDVNSGFYASSASSEPRNATTTSSRGTRPPGAQDHSSARVEGRPWVSAEGHSNRTHSTAEKRLVSAHLPGVHGPMNHLRVPQTTFQPLTGPYDPHSLRPPIQFFVEMLSEPGVRVATMSSGVAPAIQNEHDLVLEGLIEKKINVSFIWPGYECKTSRIPTHYGAVTRQGLLIYLCDMLRRWLESMKKGELGDARFVRWALGSGINMNNIFITELVHRGGADWQIELWVAIEQLR